MNLVNVVTSPISSIPLFGYHPDDNHEVPIASYGVCVGCHIAVEEAFLHMPEGADISRWPVVYQGCWCKDCFADPKQ